MFHIILQHLSLAIPCGKTQKQLPQALSFGVLSESRIFLYTQNNVRLIKHPSQKIIQDKDHEVKSTRPGVFIYTINSKVRQRLCPQRRKPFHILTGRSHKYMNVATIAFRKPKVFCHAKLDSFQE